VRTLVLAEVETGVAFANALREGEWLQPERRPAFACANTTAWRANSDVRSGESLMSCQYGTSLARPESGLDGSKAGRG
jgi:hypothetical protein